MSHSDSTMHDRLKLHLEVTDPEITSELLKYTEGPERDAYAMSALRLGVLALRHARGTVDAQAVRDAGTALMSEIRVALQSHASTVTKDIASALRQYLDPSTGALQQRLDQLIKRDGELDAVLGRHLQGDDSHLAKTLVSHVGAHSPLLKLLSPEEQGNFIGALEREIASVLEQQRQALLGEMSLDQSDSALSRLVATMTTVNGQLREEFTQSVERVKAQFSLDDPQSALSRLVDAVEGAQRGITKEFSLDHPDSSLSRLSRELSKGIEDLTRAQREFHVEVKTVLAALQARREEAARSTRHGGAFEDAVCDVLGAEVSRLGDIPTPCGTTVGRIRNSKVGDMLIELSPESAAPGERIVVEAKAAAGYDVPSARAEAAVARENRDARVSIFVFAKAYAPAGIEPLVRHGEDVIVVWDADDPATDIYLKVAYSLARWMVVERVRAQSDAAADFSAIDTALFGIAKKIESLDEIATYAGTLQSTTEKIADRARVVRKDVTRDLETLREQLERLRDGTTKGAGENA